jgi:hypothetical protein
MDDPVKYTTKTPQPPGYTTFTIFIVCGASLIGLRSGGCGKVRSDSISHPSLAFAYTTSTCCTCGALDLRKATPMTVAESNILFVLFEVEPSTLTILARAGHSRCPDHGTSSCVMALHSCGGLDAGHGRLIVPPLDFLCYFS